MSFHREEKGFTLIELLIVIAIMGIIAGIVVISVSQFTGRGEDETAKIELLTVQTAVLTYHMDNDEYPTNDGDAGDIDNKLDDYIHGTIDDLEYPTYQVDENGVVTRH